VSQTEFCHPIKREQVERVLSQCTVPGNYVKSGQYKK
jgi:hypothetical protein